MIKQVTSQMPLTQSYPTPIVGYQPHQSYDMNTERMALQRRLPDDDQWVVPHNIYLAVYSPSSVNVLAFDPTHGADQARGYACKYCAKPKRYFFLEGEKNGVKSWPGFVLFECLATLSPLVSHEPNIQQNTAGSKPAPSASVQRIIAS